jgi:hypothetical protein
VLLEVRVAPPPADPARQFKAARAAAGTGLPGVAFGEVKAALAQGRPIASGVTREAAARLAAALEAEGFAVGLARIRAGAEASPRRTRAPAVAVAGGAVAAVVVLAGGAVLLLGRGPAPERPPEPAPAEVAASPGPPRASVPGGAPPTAPPLPSPAPPPATAAEIFRRAAPAVATVTCPGRMGSGFFVAPDRLVTNAHVACGATGDVGVKVGGRELVGRLVAQDEWLDWAVVEVPGAGVEPLPAGDSTALEPGQPVVIVGNPLGLEATVHEGRVSAVARGLQGVAHVQLNADVNPGNSGGPVLDLQGRAVGIVTLGQAGGGGVGFALPIEYVRAPAALPPPEPLAAARWEATLARVAEEDAAEARRLEAQLGRAVLLALGPGAEGLTLRVMRRNPTGAVTLRLEVREGGRILCRPSATVLGWADLAEKLSELAADPATERRIRWMVRRGLARGVEGGAAEVPLGGCPDPMPPKAVLALDGDAEQALPVPVHLLADLRRVREQVKVAREEEDEGQWRAAFRAAREQVARYEEHERRMKRALDAQNDVNAVAEAREYLPRVQEELARARTALDDLERRASSRAIPREWRR